MHQLKKLYSKHIGAGKQSVRVNTSTRLWQPSTLWPIGSWQLIHTRRAFITSSYTAASFHRYFNTLTPASDGPRLNVW